MVRIIKPVGESWLSEEKLYLSDVCDQSHYQKNHPKNKGEHITDQNNTAYFQS
jgi:hypothetical protein